MILKRVFCFALCFLVLVWFLVPFVFHIWFVCFSGVFLFVLCVWLVGSTCVNSTLLGYVELTHVVIIPTTEVILIILR